jgi:hypothetical protein
MSAKKEETCKRKFASNCEKMEKRPIFYFYWITSNIIQNKIWRFEYFETKNFEEYFLSKSQNKILNHKNSVKLRIYSRLQETFTCRKLCQHQKKNCHGTGIVIKNSEPKLITNGNAFNQYKMGT